MPDLRHKVALITGSHAAQIRSEELVMRNVYESFPLGLKLSHAALLRNLDGFAQLAETNACQRDALELNSLSRR
jgi:hypothetical protein